MSTEHNGPMRMEEDIDAALKILGDTQPPAQMLLRVQQSLEIAAISKRARPRNLLLIPAAGAAIAALVLFAIFTQSHRAGRNPTPAVENARLVANTPAAQAAMMPSSSTIETVRSSEGKRLVQYSTKRGSQQNRGARHVTNLLSYPLTQQEKLLLQFARNAKLADLQALNPEYQARMEAQQDAEFAAYLKSGSPSDSETAEQTRQSTQE